MKNFRIQDSDSFLSASLSLSFGVMLFSALYSMLPSAKKSLQDGGFSPTGAAWTLILCFLGGVIGIQIISRILHQFMPSHVVDCEHTHEDEAPKENGMPHDHDQDQDHNHDHDPENGHVHSSPRPNRPRKSSLPGHMHQTESDRRTAPRRTSYFGTTAPLSHAGTVETVEVHSHQNTLTVPERPAVASRPSLQQRMTDRISQLVSGKDGSCDCGGSCYGYSDPCGHECFKNVSARGGYRASVRLAGGTVRPSVTKSLTTQSALPMSESTPLLQEIAEESRPLPPRSARMSEPTAGERGVDVDLEQGLSDESSNTAIPGADGHENRHAHLHKTNTNQSGSNPDVHHHHVPENAFLSIGLQTSIAIALHKLPEGFITYATNHANPKLGFSVFLALFMHNLTEGFALALPLYLAINSRWKAMVISFVLGGLSQPIGAGVAAIWFKLAGDGDWAPSEGVYGGMFAVTAGIMASVALQLFSESLDLTHSRMLCMVGAFTGMGILGISSALTA